MDIHLEYRGELPASQVREKHSDVKQAIRRSFADQLRRAWRDSPQLSEWFNQDFPEASRGRWRYEPPRTDEPFFFVSTCGFKAVPLVTWHNSLACELDIVITGDTRSAVLPRGDIDNRLKVLFDALRIPHREAEVPFNMHGSGSDPLFCLLEDDSLIRKFCVEAIQSPYSPPEESIRVKAHVFAMDGTHPFLAMFR